MLNVLHNTSKKRFKDRCVKVRIILKIVSKVREVVVPNWSRLLQDTVQFQAPLKATLVL